MDNNPINVGTGRNGSCVTCIAAIVFVWAAVFAWTFKPELDMNGDASQYYIYATSLARGEGYAELGTPGHPPANGFPPGYPLLMAPLRMLTDSITAQKILNGCMLLLAAIILFVFLHRVVPQRMALAAVLISLLNYRVMQFASIMMSEMSYLLFSVIAIWLLYLFDRDERRRRWWKSPFFYLLIIVAGYGYMIRAQGIALAAGIAVWLLCRREWRQAAGFAVGFAVTTLPWSIRNTMAGLGQSRYLNQIMAVNVWQPDRGTISVGDMVYRGWQTLQMLVTKAVPDTVTPYMRTDYAVAPTLGEWIAGLLLIALILFGFWRMRRFFWFFTAYSAAVAGIICMWSAPSGNRYITALVPLLEAGLTVGVCTVAQTAVRRVPGIGKTFNPLWLMIPGALFAGNRLKTVARESKMAMSQEEAGFIDAARAVRTNLPAETMVCSRKPSVFYVYAGCHVCNFIPTEDDERLICGLVESGADYVVLDQLGYGATRYCLYPAVMKHRELFEVVGAFRQPQTYLLRFDRAAAEAKFGRKP